MRKIVPEKMKPKPLLDRSGSRNTAQPRGTAREEIRADPSTGGGEELGTRLETQGSPPEKNADSGQKSASNQSTGSDQKNSSSQNTRSNQPTGGRKWTSSASENIPLDMDSLAKRMHATFRNCSDIVMREIIAVNGDRVMFCYIDGLVDTFQLDEVVLRPLMDGLDGQTQNKPGQSREATIQDMAKQFVAVGQTAIIGDFRTAVDSMMTGTVLFFVDGCDQALSLSLKKWEHRAVSEPDTEAVIRGPREGFVENIRTNTALIRRRIRTPDLKMEAMKIGSVTQTDVVLAYVDGIATESIVNEVRKRLSDIQIDGVLDSGYVEEFIEDQPFSPFPQVQPTERPDTATASLLEGRCVVIVDGSPNILILPVNLWGALQASEDYYERFLFSTLLRWLRFIFVIIALTLPSLYVAITTFHQEMLPTNLLLSVAAARESTPFPALVEAFLMEVTFEALREAGVRLPKTVGQAVSIVGALVIGQAAVQAGIVSAPMVIVVSITGIANFTIPRYSFGLGIRMLRFPLMILAGTFGLYGIVIGLIAIIIHVCSLRSVGVPYLTPVAPFTLSDMKDTGIRTPWWAMYRRPLLFARHHGPRVAKDQRPLPPISKSGGEEGAKDA